MSDTMLYAGGGVVLLLVVIAVVLITRQQSRAGRASGKRDIFAQLREQAAKNPKDSGIELKWGHALAARAGEARNPALRLQAYKEAAEHFRRATELTPSMAVPWKNLGQTLFILFRLENCEDKVILDQAQVAYESAVRLSPLDPAMWQHWGEDLYMTAAYCTHEERKEELVSLAKVRYARAVALRPELMEDWKSWGGSNADLAEIQAAAEKAKSQDGVGEPEEGDLSAATGTKPPQSPASEGSMPWEVGGDITDPEKFFAATAPAAPAPVAASSEPARESVAPVAPAPVPKPETSTL